MHDIIYNAYNSLNEILKDNMPDVNPDRSAKGGRFVYPTLPTSLDDNYPRVTIKLDEFTPSAVGAGNVLDYYATERRHGMQVSMLFRMLIFVKKETEYPIDIDGKSVRAKNELLIQHLNKLCYLAVFNSLTSGRLREEGFWVNSVGDITILPGVFEFDTHRIASEVSIRLNGIEHTEKLYGESELIDDINRTVSVLLNAGA